MAITIIDNFSSSNPPAETGYDLAKFQADYKGHASAAECVKAGDIPDMSVEVKRAAGSSYGTLKLQHKQITFNVVNPSAVITTGLKKRGKIKGWSGTIKGWSLLADVSSSITITIKKCADGAYPTTVSIVAAAKPILTAALEASSTTLTAWTIAIADGDDLEMYVDTNDNAKDITLILDVEVTN